MRARGFRAEKKPQALERIDNAVVGRLVSFRDGDPRVDYPGNSLGPLVARVSASIDDAALESAAREHQDVVLMFDGGDPEKPLLTALLRSATHRVDALLAPLPEKQRVARVDGKQVVIEGDEEVVLKCGKASLTLRRDGKVVLRGVNLVTQAEQVHKVRGGKVQIN